MEHFSKISYIIPILQSQDYEVVPVWGRIRKLSGEDFFFSETLATGSTIPHCLMLKKVTLPVLVEASEFDPAIHSKDNFTSSIHSYENTPPHLITLFELSSPGVCSHPSTAHGGLLSTILDEAMAHTLAAHFSTDPEKIDDVRRTLLTSKLEVAFKRPVRAPGILIVKSWCVAYNGRRHWMKAQAVQIEPVNGQPQGQEEVKLEASGLWIKTSSKL
ncbi:uncharacterized protein TrAFT101_003660 [Trichoderma asperellum]|uniref:Thioesterase domain-containing protein n=1 Tax=Trichoderma asperellum (strain ATCC 204424 / CBS 433.97 / NBRC 101777) TaxID=1042311 RepID=A0A2T3ZQ14_TRIA4|nr:hypothetical protein M441DRAFT_22861 [Trichoderma asperellum CBS 433.97]PTB46902.1 hypothetical protein M441DRAFT_22861 [Trichoderma asperellum CBS 433.97]UKZ87888.1 hypothetical protein TrAFT101_003660 [Trichoderma asperellum]